LSISAGSACCAKGCSLHLLLSLLTLAVPLTFHPNSACLTAHLYLLTFSPLAALAGNFYCEHCMFSVSFRQFLFFAKRKAELLRAVEEGEGKRAQRGGCRGEGGNKNKGTERRKRFGFRGGKGLRASRRSLLTRQARRESSERKKQGAPKAQPKL
jgi:hypothetical protein